MREARRPATLADVAREAGVSVPTASRVLNGGVRGAGTGSPEMRERVQRAATAVGYAPSAAAQAIKGGRARSVALIVSDVDNLGSARLIAGVIRAAEARGISVAVRATHDDEARERAVLEQLRGERHRAIVMATSRTTDEAREAAVRAALVMLREEGAAIAIIGDSTLPFPSVTVDARAAAAALAVGLVGLGLRRFAVVSGPPHEVTARDRLAGFLDGLAACGLTVPQERIATGTFSRDGGVHASAALGRVLHEVDAIAAMSDAMAIGVVVQARAAGLRVPGDLVVSGFDGISALSDLLPDFSTVAIPFDAFGEAALGLAIDAGAADPAERVALGAIPIVAGRARTPGAPTATPSG